MGLHPCQQCGACCASFRVEFSLGQNPSVQSLSEKHWVALNKDGVCCMAGTESKHRPKCAALRGKIGENVQCTVYEARPAPCRNFTASFEFGARNERCDQARAKHGLAPLTGADWKRFRLKPA